MPDESLNHNAAPGGDDGDQPFVTSPEYGEDDVQRIHDWLVRKGVKPIHDQDTDDDSAAVWFWCQRAIRYSRMRWNSDDAAMAAIAAVFMESDEYHVWTRMAGAIQAMFDAGADMGRHKDRSS